MKFTTSIILAATAAAITGDAAFETEFLAAVRPQSRALTVAEVIDYVQQQGFDVVVIADSKIFAFRDDETKVGVAGWGIVEPLADGGFAAEPHPEAFIGDLNGFLIEVTPDDGTKSKSEVTFVARLLSADGVAGNVDEDDYPELLPLAEVASGTQVPKFSAAQCVALADEQGAAKSLAFDLETGAVTCSSAVWDFASNAGNIFGNGAVGELLMVPFELPAVATGGAQWV